MLTLMRFEWGSVQMKLASMMRTFDKPRRRRRQRARSSLDSRVATTHWLGGWSHRSQSLQQRRVDSRWMLDFGVNQHEFRLRTRYQSKIRTYPWVTSTFSFRQSWHIAPAEVVPSMGAPQLQHRILGKYERNSGQTRLAVRLTSQRPGAGPAAPTWELAHPNPSTS